MKKEHNLIIIEGTLAILRNNNKLVVQQLQNVVLRIPIQSPRLMIQLGRVLTLICIIVTVVTFLETIQYLHIKECKVH